jgi:hypothetical protein
LKTWRISYLHQRKKVNHVHLLSRMFRARPAANFLTIKSSATATLRFTKKKRESISL